MIRKTLTAMAALTFAAAFAGGALAQDKPMPATGAMSTGAMAKTDGMKTDGMAKADAKPMKKTMKKKPMAETGAMAKTDGMKTDGMAKTDAMATGAMAKPKS